EELQNLSDVIEINNSANDQIKDLTDPTDTQDAATKSYVDGVVNLSVSLTGDTLYVGSQWVIIPGVSDANSSGSDDIVDGSGNIYTSVVIGDQEWLVENLKTTKYINGTDIPNETDGTSWANLSTPAYCWYDNDEAQYANPYGALYNWFAVDAGDLCPLGWHVPTGDEWGILKDELGGITSAGGKLKETGFEHWLDPNTGATNESGFTATGSGRRDNDGTFEIMMMNATFWGSTPGSIGGQGNNAILSHESVYFVGGSNISYWFETGMTVRCIKDSGSTSSKSQNNQVDIKKLEKIHQENSDLFFIGE
ncbi:MAG: fibrobacter succinogenes major paralogous domain-containing protein, partial [Bacteroidales bacterium]|nr:fibrobacter succinogenes major paralogous domain-containing protein [Bacteroidales bacterium]